MFMGKAMQLNDTLCTRNSEQAYHYKTAETDPNTHEIHCHVLEFKTFIV